MATAKRRSSALRHHRPTLRDVARRLSDLHTHVLEQGKLLERLLTMSKNQLEALKRIDAATTNIAGDIRRLKDKVDDPEVNAELEKQASRLEAMAADPENPDPEAPPVEENPTL